MVSADGPNPIYNSPVPRSKFAWAQVRVAIVTLVHRARGISPSAQAACRRQRLEGAFPSLLDAACEAASGFQRTRVRDPVALRALDQVNFLAINRRQSANS